MFLAQSVIMAKIISLIFERVDGLVFDPPTGSATTHTFPNNICHDLKVCHSTETFADDKPFIPVLNLPIFQKVDLQFLLTCLVEEKGVDRSKTMGFLLVIRIGQDEFRYFATQGGFNDQIEQIGMVAWLGQ